MPTPMDNYKWFIGIKKSFFTMPALFDLHTSFMDINKSCRYSFIPTFIDNKNYLWITKYNFWISIYAYHFTLSLFIATGTNGLIWLSINQAKEEGRWGPIRIDVFLAWILIYHLPSIGICANSEWLTHYSVQSC